MRWVYKGCLKSIIMGYRLEETQDFDTLRNFLRLMEQLQSRKKLNALILEEEERDRSYTYPPNMERLDRTLR